MGDAIELAEVPNRVKDFLVEYAFNFVNVIAAPVSTFSPSNPAIVAINTASVLKALGFASLSIALSGILWQAFVPDQSTGAAGKAVVLVFVLLSWVVFSCFYYILSKIFGGTAKLLATLQSSLIIKSVLYLFAVFASIGIVSSLASDALDFNILFFLVYEISVTIFISIALSSLNGFNRLRTAGFSVTIFLITLIPSSLFIVGVWVVQALSRGIRFGS